MAKKDIFVVRAINIEFSKGRYILFKDGTDTPEMEWVSFTDKDTGRTHRLECVMTTQGLLNAMIEFQEAELEIVYYQNPKEKRSYIAGVKTYEVDGELTGTHSMNEYSNLTVSNLDDFKSNRIFTYFLFFSFCLAAAYTTLNSYDLLMSLSCGGAVLLGILSFLKMLTINGTHDVFNRLNQQLRKHGYEIKKSS
ncbi:hypothetical protein BCU70_05650 [Vibrio sp. 10N.286.49.C2]|uniref:hypothetical protein n=1 Tax=unclassified Vibrio TaxID=2614977 RepID=UPI000C8518C7|nr:MULTISPECIES: hypothetical protein [unclassified Vibrio]PMH33958.1 hypothetical protein BCU70_05650 [Vibrio sp. 10N.286.49.C2]PMH44217.1 hypothetical protein BCU66_04570 [Vibrio sp. 10N.286.49.B1]PMH82931.1 hypothetical protein BCU58_16480 [Vibrio sp. 10N.286.48.B7]